jgi:hypothetical protein
MIFKARTAYRHKTTKTIITQLKDVEVTSKWLFDQYEEIKQDTPEPRKPDQSYNVKRMIEKNTGVEE